MNAEPLLIPIARLLAKHRLDVVMIGNAAAAIQGSPVTTLDVDFMFRKTSTTLRKLKALADDLDARVLRPIYPAPQLFASPAIATAYSSISWPRSMGSVH